MKYPDFKQPLIVTTNASDMVLGAVLSQKEDNIQRPIAYASHTYRVPKLNTLPQKIKF